MDDAGDPYRSPPPAAAAAAAEDPNPPPPPLPLDRTQFMRIIIQSLYSLGYQKTASVLEFESGILLDSPEYAALIFHVLSGRWDDCIAVIDTIKGIDASTRSAAAYFLVWREHFLELLGSGGSRGLLPVLRDRISPMDDVDRRRVHGLALTMLNSEGGIGIEDSIRRRIGLLLELAEVLPPWVRLSERRLEKLVEAAVLRKLDNCLYHNMPEEITLYEDHECSREHIPSRCIQTLNDHKNEVWCVQFSHNGEYLLSSSSDCTAIIWKVNEENTVSLWHSLEGHSRPVSLVSWSPDDTMLLTCGNGEALKLWDVDTGACKLTFSSLVNSVISSCAWFPNSKRIVCGSCEPNNRIYICDLEGNELEAWEGQRMPKVSDLAVTDNGCWLISICSKNEIWICEFPKGKERVISEEHSITSLSLSRDGQSLIVNLNSEEIHLWSIQHSSNVPHRFRGHKQGKYVIRSCFGGSNCLFIASGSEDSQVYIWQRHQETPIQVLSGHSMTVNCVSWNPTKHHMLASASDDRTIRIWVANRRPTTVDK